MADPTFSYGCLFAGVPFLTDMGMSYQANIPAEVGALFSGRLNEVEMMAELDRLLPFRHTRDIVPAPQPGRNLDALSVGARGPELTPEDRFRVGEFYHPATASRWSVFRGVMLSSMVKAVLKVTNGSSPAAFTMKNVPVGLPGINPAQYTITTNLYMLPPRPIAEHGGTFDGVYLVTLVDERYYWQGTPATLRVTSTTAWADLIDQLADVLGVSISYSAIDSVYGQPEPDSQLWVNAESAAALLDALAANVGRVVVRNLDGTYQLLTPLESRARVTANRGNIATLIRHAGGDLFSSGTRIPAGNLTPSRNAVVPEQVNVTFPKYVRGNDPVPHFLNPRYATPRPSCWYEDSYGDTHTVSVPVTSGGASVSGLAGVGDQTLRTTAKALYDSEATAASGMAPLNASGLGALARRLAADHYDAQAATALDEVYPGTFAWDPEGTHDIVWTYSNRARGAFTRVIRTEWNNSPSQFQHRGGALSGSPSIVSGVGGPSVAQTYRVGTGGVGSGPIPGVNLVGVGSGLALYGGALTSGGITEAVIALASGIGVSSGGAATSGEDCFCCGCASGLSGQIACVSGYPSCVISGEYVSVSGYPFPLPTYGLGIVYITVSGYPYPIQSGANLVVSGCFKFPVCSGVWQQVSGYPYPVQSGLASISGYPYPMQSGLILTSGFQYPLASGPWQMVSGYPFPVNSGDNWVIIPDWPTPVKSGTNPTNTVTYQQTLDWNDLNGEEFPFYTLAAKEVMIHAVANIVAFTASGFPAPPVPLFSVGISGFNTRYIASVDATVSGMVQSFQLSGNHLPRAESYTNSVPVIAFMDLQFSGQLVSGRVTINLLTAKLP